MRKLKSLNAKKDSNCSDVALCVISGTTVPERVEDPESVDFELPDPEGVVCPDEERVDPVHEPRNQFVQNSPKAFTNWSSTSSSP